MIDLDLLRTFLAIYRTGSVTRAAGQLSITQPAATARLRSLESTLRRPLFKREGRGLQPTAAADDLARSIAPHLDGLEAVVTMARGQGGALAGAVHLGGPVEFLGAKILPALAGLHEHGIRLRLRLGLAGELVETLAAGGLDFAVATVRIANDGVGYAKLYRERFVLVGAPHWVDRLAGRVGAALAEGPGGAPVLAYAEDLPIIRRYWRDVFGKEPELQASTVIGDLRALIQASTAGAGITVVPSYLCEAELMSGRLMLLHQPANAPGNDIHLAWSKFALRHPRNAFMRDTLLAAAEGWRSSVTPGA